MRAASSTSTETMTGWVPITCEVAPTSLTSLMRWFRYDGWTGIRTSLDRASTIAEFSFELTKGTAKRNAEAHAINPEDEKEGTKAFWVARHPAMEEYSKFRFAPMNEEGFH